MKGMLRITEAIDIKRAVEKELDWFASTYPRPLSVISHPATDSIKKFQILFTEKNLISRSMVFKCHPMKWRIFAVIGGSHLIMYIGCLTI